MRSYIKERTIKEAEYILDNKCSIRTAAKYFNVSKSTLHYDLQKRLKLINIDGNEKEYFKLYSENTKYLKKNKLWVDPAINEDRIYDNLQEEWDY